MKIITQIIVLILVGSHCCFTQENPELEFPEKYFGNYQGILEIDTSMGVQKVPMEFQLQPTDSLHKFQYVLVYGEGEKKQERAYTLVAQDRDNGRYLVDENNGIQLNAQVFGNRFYSMFEVSENLLTTFITFQSDFIIFEIAVANRQSALKTVEKEEGIEVVSYPVFTRQRAQLFKQ